MIFLTEVLSHAYTYDLYRRFHYVIKDENYLQLRVQMQFLRTVNTLLLSCKVQSASCV